ncbi:MAG TPA: class I SAM-dependent methyltransferase [Polyangiaceae bacterium]|jgi:SAM-dependent methyltransferase
MQNDPGAGYLTDVPYVRQFCKELAPPLLRAAAALNGFTPPPADDFDYCELGCGPGDTMNTLAAAHPRARFVGVDLDEAHVAAGRELASRGGLANVRYVHGDLARLHASDLPACDYVVAHGVLSWVPATTRAALVELAAARLKPGGVLYVSYNALPGWAAVEPLRRLLRELADRADGSRIERAHHASMAAQLLRDCGAEYFTSNPAASEMLTTVLRMGPTYAAHEYLGEHWNPMYFADVAREMSARGLAFIGQLPLAWNYRDLTVPQTALELFRDVSDRATFESLKDFAVNEFFRGDLYAKSGAGRDPATTEAYLAETAFGTAVPAAAVKREVHLRHHALHFDDPVSDAVIQRLAAAPATLAELAGDEALASFGNDAVRGTVHRLLLGEQLLPLRPGVAPVPADYTRAVLDQPLTPENPVILASTVAGTGVVVPTLQAVALRMLTGVAPADRPAWARAFVARQHVKLVVGEAAVQSAEEQARVLLQELDTFRAKRLPKLVELGVIASTAS